MALLPSTTMVDRDSDEKRLVGGGGGHDECLERCISLCAPRNGV